ncbi:MAG: DHHW family protein [Clostridiaceae bacterium]
MKSSFNKIFFFIFAFVWAGLILWNITTPSKVFSENENRYLAVLPKLTGEKFINGEYMNGLDEYVDDQFVIRDEWIGIKVVLERAILKQEINSVYFAKDNYLIEKHNDSDVSEEQAEKNRDDVLEFIKKQESILGKDRVKFMLVPTASEILTDKLPLFAAGSGYNQNAYLDKMASVISKGSLIDVRNILNKHKDEYIYYRTDHHWTTLGAYYAYVQWAETLEFNPIDKEQFDIHLVSDQFYGTLHSKVNTNVKPDDLYLYELKEEMSYHLTYNLVDKTDTLYDLKKLEGKDKYSVYMGGNNALIEVQTNNMNGRKLLVIKDSYAHSCVPFMVNHFEKTYMIDLRYYNGDMDDFILDNEITDVLVLYNVMGFVEDVNIGKLVY